MDVTTEYILYDFVIQSDVFNIAFIEQQYARSIEQQYARFIEQQNVRSHTYTFFIFLFHSARSSNF